MMEDKYIAMMFAAWCAMILGLAICETFGK